VILIARVVCLLGFRTFILDWLGLALGFCNITKMMPIFMFVAMELGRNMRSARDTRYEYDFNAH
jgi:hypothetical protein